MKIGKRIFKIILAALGVALILAFYFYFRFKPTVNPIWGINFSTAQARYLGLNIQEVYQDILTDLKPKKVRLMVYWEDIEGERGEYNFDEMDSLLKLSEKAGTKIILVVGHKEPRWPECHHPEWYNNLDEAAKRQAALSLVKAEAEHFKVFSAIERWQVENEPFFNYGPNCPTLTSRELEDEIDLVKTLDPRPIVVTDSGEKGLWIPAAKLADIFGTTMYRTVHQSKFGGYFTYPLPPAWYRMRAGMAEALTQVKNVIDVEMQAEPWFKSDFYSAPVDEQLKLMDVKKLRKNFNYAKATGLPEHYLWGAEWWYYMKGRGHPEFWEAAKQLILN